jgi:hypothetical protein
MKIGRPKLQLNLLGLKFIPHEYYFLPKLIIMSTTKGKVYTILLTKLITNEQPYIGKKK